MAEDANEPSTEYGIPVLKSSEVVVDRTLGNGGFCTVCAIRRVEVNLSLSPCDDDDSTAARSRLAKRFQNYEKSHFSYLHVPGQPPPPANPADQKPPKIALKRVKADLPERKYETGVRDLTAEVSILSMCDHPNIITLYALGRDDDDDGDGNNRPAKSDRITFAVIDQLRSTLKNKLYLWRESRGLGIMITRKALNTLWLERMVVLARVADAIKYLHSKGIVHRDISPDNIGFDGDDVVKLFDFGLARKLGKRDGSRVDATHSRGVAAEDNGGGVDDDDQFELTENTGTLRYMAPEVNLGLPYGLKVDVHSFAIVMLEVLSLVKPYTNVRPFAFTSVVVKGGLRPTIDASWSPVIRDLLQQMWASDSAKRPSSRQVVEVLEKLLRGSDENLYPRSRGLKSLFADEAPPNRIGGLST